MAGCSAKRRAAHHYHRNNREIVPTAIACEVPQELRLNATHLSKNSTVSCFILKLGSVLRIAKIKIGQGRPRHFYRWWLLVHGIAKTLGYLLAALLTNLLFSSTAY